MPLVMGYFDRLSINAGACRYLLLVRFLSYELIIYYVYYNFRAAMGVEPICKFVRKTCISKGCYAHMSVMRVRDYSWEVILCCSVVI